VVAVLGIVVVAVLYGCQAGMSPGLDETGGLGDAGGPADARTWGGSIPDGGYITGRVVTYSAPTGYRVLVRCTSDSITTYPYYGALVTLASADGKKQYAKTGWDGRFAITKPCAGAASLSFFLRITEEKVGFDVSSSTGVRHDSIAALAIGEPITAASSATKLSITAPAGALTPYGRAATLQATLAGATLLGRDIVWTMRTDTDATIALGRDPSKLVVTPGALTGTITLRAESETAVSNEITLQVTR
jgi:hypothetical protein